MNQLREAVLKELSFQDEADQDIANYILDAVIEALPEEKTLEKLPSTTYQANLGWNNYQYVIKQILLDAKEDK